MTTASGRALAAATVAGLVLASGAAAQDKRVGHQGIGSLANGERASVYVEPVSLTEVYDQTMASLNVGAVVADASFAAGLQKAADVWGLNLDLFRIQDQAERQRIAERLVETAERVVIVDSLPTEDWTELGRAAERRQVALQVHSAGAGQDAQRFQRGFDALKAARATLLPTIPKYDQILPVAFPVSPLPDSFFQPSKFPYPKPLVRVERTAESLSASAHAHTSCNMVAQTGNMLHRTSSIDPDVFLMGMEGGNLSLKALPGAAEPQKVSAVMTSWVMAVRGSGSEQRDIIVENDGLESSFFKPAIHAPEELDLALEDWRAKGLIRGHRRMSYEEVAILGWDGADRTMRAGMFLVASDRRLEGPELVPGRDITGRRTLDFYSTQSFVQQLVEILPKGSWSPAGPTIQPTGGTLTEGGASVGNTVGAPLGRLLRKVEQPRPDFQPYVLSLEGGFFVVTPEVDLTQAQLQTAVARVDLDLRGPLTSDQTIWITLANGDRLTFRRTVLNFAELDRALDFFRTLGFVQDWKYDGARGRGLNANLVLQQFLGRHRKFMSSLATWPNEERPQRPVIRFYVDGMQRLNFTFISTTGWRQEFVEVPLRVPPVPRDVELYSGVAQLN